MLHIIFSVNFICIAELIWVANSLLNHMVVNHGYVTNVIEPSWPNLCQNLSFHRAPYLFRAGKLTNEILLPHIRDLALNHGMYHTPILRF